MFEGLKKIFGIGPGVNYKELVEQGALIVDVRTKGEYQSGHINKSLNIPVDSIQGQLKQFKKKDYYLLCFRNEKRQSSQHFKIKRLYECI
jgi:phage shock protein E